MYVHACVLTYTLLAISAGESMLESSRKDAIALINQWLSQPARKSPDMKRVRALMMAIRGEGDAKRYSQASLTSALNEGPFTVTRNAVANAENAEKNGRKKIADTTLKAIAWLLKPDSIESEADPQWRAWLEKMVHWSGLKMPDSIPLEKPIPRSVEDEIEALRAEMGSVKDSLRRLAMLHSPDELLRARILLELLRDGIDIDSEADLNKFRRVVQEWEGEGVIEMLQGDRAITSINLPTLAFVLKEVTGRDRWTAHFLKELDADQKRDRSLSIHQ